VSFARCSPSLLRLVVLCCSADHRALHSFPTRRSSDLVLRQWRSACSRRRNFIKLIHSALLRVSSMRRIQCSTQTRWIACFVPVRSEEHTSELQSRENLVCRLLLEKKKHEHDAIETEGH